MTVIVGAGLAGLIAAHIFPRHKLIEAAPEPAEGHQALLRFRSDSVSKLTGIDFRRVTVRKGIFYNNEFVAPTIALANKYAKKCLGQVVGERSIWKLEPVERFIAPQDFYWRLVEANRDRIEWATPFDFAEAKGSSTPIISTAPMPVALSALGIEAPVDFARAGIAVRRYKIDGCDVHQTVYFPGGDTTMYRASITGDVLIAEFIGEPDVDWQRQVFVAFGLSPTLWTALGGTNQRYGKIAPIDEQVRMSLICKLTAEHNILSLGRFACWRNVLLDDVVNDAAVVKRLMNLSQYERRILAAKGA